MKAFITSGDKQGRVDGSVIFHLFHSVEIVPLSECDLIFIVITHLHDYQPDHDLYNAMAHSGKKIVVVDYVEYGWDKSDSDHIFGINTEDYIKYFACKEYIHLDDFVKTVLSNIIIYFKRELLVNAQTKAPFPIVPIDYTGILKRLTGYNIPFEKYDIPQSFEEFGARPIDILMIWGRSNPSREKLHGEIMKRAHENGWNIVTRAETLNHPEYTDREGKLIQKNLVVLLYQQHFERLPMDQCLWLQQNAKITISLNGCGRKCFRHSEASYNSVMALQENGLQWAYPWRANENCIELPNFPKNTLLYTEPTSDILKISLKEQKELYNIYLNGIENYKNYESYNYTENYFMKHIKEALNGL